MITDSLAAMASLTAITWIPLYYCNRFNPNPNIRTFPNIRSSGRRTSASINAETLSFSDSFEPGAFGLESDPNPPPEHPQCPPGLRQYETMAVLRPYMTEDERIALTQKYEELYVVSDPNYVGKVQITVNSSNIVDDISLTEEMKTQDIVVLLVAGGGMYIEVFNRGVIPLAYGIRRKNKAGETNTYFDGIYLLFTYFTKPESINILEETLKADDNIIRTMTSKIRKRKY
ncbi:hypothetical protein Fmac_020552 [Flemingia macrophylla]|uniref:Ribosomal protein S6 n=1 Tax=Flemingia macrophylla TaxID=520843 RepID=A0ABD1LW52_9FABA